MIDQALEQRLATLEHEVAELKRQLNSDISGRQQHPAGESWFDAIAGSMAEFPEWSEVCQVGRKIGNAQGGDGVSAESGN